MLSVALTCMLYLFESKFKQCFSQPFLHAKTFHSVVSAPLLVLLPASQGCCKNSRILKHCEASQYAPQSILLNSNKAMNWLGTYVQLSHSGYMKNSALIMTLSLGLEKNYTSERSSNSFPGTTCTSGCLENCQKSIPKSWCSPIQGTISDFLLNYRTDLSPCFYLF